MNSAYNYLKKILKENDKVVVTTSGGPDSMALLHLILSLREEKNLEIICAHVNHNTGRVGQIEEQEYVKKYCNENNINFELMIIENYSNDNFEKEARNKRYEYFEKIIKKYNAKYLFTAHHGDDLVETILMRIVRGSTLKGYGGFSKVVDMGNYKIIRPLIELTKEEIIKYNQKNNIKYFVDKTNFDDNYTRNRYRKYILPKLKEEDKNVHLKFYKFSKMLIEYNDYIDSQVKKIINDVYINNVLDLKKFNLLEHVIKTKIIYYILEHTYQDSLISITDKHVELIYNLCETKKANTSINLPDNIKITKNYDRLKFENEEEQLENYEIEITDYVKLPNDHYIYIIDDIDSDSNFVCRLNKEDVLLPLHVRNRRNGDKINVKGLNGNKKINDIFIDNKINPKERMLWPIVEDSNGLIVWLPGLKKSKFDKTKEEKYDIILKYQ